MVERRWNGRRERLRVARARLCAEGAGTAAHMHAIRLQTSADETGKIIAGYLRASSYPMPRAEWAGAR